MTIMATLLYEPSKADGEPIDAPENWGFDGKRVNDRNASLFGRPEQQRGENEKDTHIHF